MEITIYKITSPSGKNYVGRTNNFGGRMNEHKSESERERRYHYPLYKAARKYGWDNMEITELAKCSKEDMYDLELYYINKYNGFDGYNTQRDTTQGGDVWKGRYNSQEYKDFVELQRENNSGYKNGMFGKTHTSETIQKQKQKAKGRFSLDWYIDRNGQEEGTRLYEERRQWLRTRNLKKDKYGRFISKN